MFSRRRSTGLFGCALALWLGLASPGALRAQDHVSNSPVPVTHGSGSLVVGQAGAAGVVAARLAESWSWAEFVKFWHRQAGRTTGVLGIVLLVGLGAALLILAKSSRT